VIETYQAYCFAAERKHQNLSDDLTEDRFISTGFDMDGLVLIFVICSGASLHTLLLLLSFISKSHGK
jgi:hypothetical protein